jgi:hypothetical protein
MTAESFGSDLIIQLFLKIGLEIIEARIPQVEFQYLLKSVRNISLPFSFFLE